MVEVTFREYGVKDAPELSMVDTEGEVRNQDIPLAAVQEAVKQLLDEQ